MLELSAPSLQSFAGQRHACGRNCALRPAPNRYSRTIKYRQREPAAWYAL
jgi:hypothetical protein